MLALKMSSLELAEYQKKISKFEFLKFFFIFFFHVHTLENMPSFIIVRFHIKKLTPPCHPEIRVDKNLMDVHMRSIEGNFHQKPNFYLYSVHHEIL